MRQSRRRGLTLVEMLVAMAVTLIMMGAVVTIFGFMGNSIADSRASMEVSERLRNVRNRLQTDLGGITATMLPPRRPDFDEGGFAYSEGPNKDFTFITPFGLLGDTDDILWFTSHSKTEPFVGKSAGGSIQSQTAEVIWYALPNGQTLLNPDGTSVQLYTLYRRVLLVAPSATVSTAFSLPNFQQFNDISARPTGTSTVALNNLGDLTKRENRWRHGFPVVFDTSVTPPQPQPFAYPSGGPTFPFPLTLPIDTTGKYLSNNEIPLGNFSGSDRTGDDVVLTNVLAFDVRAWDPYAPLRFKDVDGSNSFTTGDIVLSPGDVGYAAASANVLGTTGAYVDLDYAVAAGSNFSNVPNIKSQLTVPTYDTWSLHYEQNGVDEDHDNGADGGTNGLDDDDNGIVDEPDEFDTLPPYPVPLRGIQIKIRVYEPDSRQVREVTVVQDFMSQ